MTYFLDTSALVKLYLDETQGAYVRSLIAGTRPVVCRITWAEAVAAMARRNREASAAIDWLNPARQSLREDWSRFLVVEVTQALLEQAGELMWKNSPRVRGRSWPEAGRCFERDDGQEIRRWLSRR